MAQVIQANQQPPGQPPRPPRKNPYRDGSSRCGQQHDVFDMIRNPHTVKRPPIVSSHDNSKNRGSKQHKIDQEIQKKFQQNPPTLLWNRFIILRKITKFLFFAILFPFYLLLYQIPAVICLKLLPFIFNTIKNRIYNFRLKLASKFRSAMQKIKAPFIKIRRAVKKAKDRVTDSYVVFFLRPSTYVNFVTKIVRYCHKTYHGWVSSLKDNVLRIRQALRKAHKFIQSILTTIRGLPKKGLQQSKRSIQIGLNWVKTNIKGYVTKFCLEGRLRYQKCISLLNQAAKNSLDWTLNVIWRRRSFKKIYYLFKEGGFRLHKINLKKYNSVYFRAKNQELLLFLEKVCKASHQSFVYCKSLFQSLATKRPFCYITPIRKWISSQFAHSRSKIKLITNPLLSCYQKQTHSLKFTTRQLTHNVTEHFRSYKLQRRVENPERELGRKYLYSQWNRFKNFMGRIWMRVRPLAIRSRLNLTLLKTKVQNLILPFLHRSHQRLDRAFLKLRIMAAWAKVLFVYGMYQMAIVSKEIGLGL